MNDFVQLTVPYYNPEDLDKGVRNEIQRLSFTMGISDVQNLIDEVAFAVETGDYKSLAAFAINSGIAYRKGSTPKFEPPK